MAHEAHLRRSPALADVPVILPTARAARVIA